MAVNTAQVGKRSDADIFGDARRALDERATIPAGVHVHVEQGVLTLTGGVRWAAQRAEAEHVVSGIAGVRRVVNDLTVAQIVNKEGFETPDVA